MKNLNSILKKTDAKNKGVFKPQLTSLIDVMTILLVFLIQSFSVDGNLITQSADLVLPLSSSQKKPRLVTTIEITKDGIISEGLIIAQNKSFSEADSLLIPNLFEYMKGKKAQLSDLQKLGEVMIQSDKENEFSVIKKVMFTCSKAGFKEFSLLVTEEI